jgi:diacylglycerol kinase family enzyme
MAGVGVILNPYSKKYKKNPDGLERMAFIVGDKASCKSTHDLVDLMRVAEEFKTREIDILAISGGDGTIHCTLTTFLRVYGEKPLPKITFLRGGTLNTVAATMGVRSSTERILSDLLVKYHEDIPFEVKKLRLMKINDDYGCIFGLGLIYNFMDSYYAGTPGAWGAVKTLSKCIGSGIVNGAFVRRMFRRFDAEVLVNGKSWPFANYSAIYAASIRQFGLGFNVFYHMMTQNEKFHAQAFSMPPRWILPYIKRMHDGKNSGSEDVVDEMAETMEIRLSEPAPYTIDGDMLPGLTYFKIGVGPELSILT